MSLKARLQRERVAQREAHRKPSVLPRKPDQTPRQRLVERLAAEGKVPPSRGKGRGSGALPAYVRYPFHIYARNGQRIAPSVTDSGPEGEHERQRFNAYTSEWLAQRRKVLVTL